MVGKIIAILSFFWTALVVCCTASSKGIEISVITPFEGPFYEVGQEVMIIWTIEKNGKSFFYRNAVNFSIKKDGITTDLDMFSFPFDPSIQNADNVYIWFGPSTINVLIPNLRYNDTYEFICQTVLTLENKEIKKSVVSLAKIYGGVKNCGIMQFEDRYIFTESSSPTIWVTLCGNPQPDLKYTWNGETRLASLGETIDSETKMYKYAMELENISRMHCGTQIKFVATGYERLEKTAKVYVLYKPDAGDFEVVKETNRHGDGKNCTVYNFPNFNTGCRERYNIYFFDKWERVLKVSVNLSIGFYEYEDCNHHTSRYSFDDVAFTRVQVIRWDGLTGEMSDLKRIDEKKIVLENGQSVVSRKSIILLAIVCFVSVVAIVVVVLSCRWTHCSKNIEENHAKKLKESQMNEEDTEEEREDEKKTDSKEVFFYQTKPTAVKIDDLL
ncbi:uncharacterized protein [Clytia hemisphaerica]|uniref:Cnidarian restricted protein n=1 Tax=Clytia hemisphaerica TaxID=252671 RepID=A0A7M5XCY6_9CNID